MCACVRQLSTYFTISLLVSVDDAGLLLLLLVLGVCDGRINTTSDFNKCTINAEEPSFNFIRFEFVLVSSIGWNVALFVAIVAGTVDGGGSEGDKSVALNVSTRFQCLSGVVHVMVQCVCGFLCANGL